MLRFPFILRHYFSMTIAPPSKGGPPTRGVTTRNRGGGGGGLRLPLEPVTPSSKRLRKATAVTTPSPAATNSDSNMMAYQQWLEDVSNVDISLSISLQPPTPSASELNTSASSDEASEESVHAVSLSVSLPTMMSRIIQ